MTQAQLAKSIVLFSDGTGNSSAKLFKTNVWRMYEAVDLGVTPSGSGVQVAYYDNGVGTQSIRALAMLAGIFGFGLKRNILRLYRFVCRNYREGDRIYAFGFSRGAFTIRMVVALLASEGVVQYASEGELQARSLDAFRRFSAGNNPHFAPAIGRAARAIRDRWIRAKRFIMGPRLDNEVRLIKGVILRFVGVWDTVAAYGGPITEITRGIDALIYPLTMSDTRLSPQVEVARHALAIDDERDAFHPVLWDELHWKELADAAHPEGSEANVAFQDRLKQVWFSGMHADVGGGYPDESLSFVSLCWMMAEAEREGLRLLPEHKDRVHDMSNSLGPMHNSRGGLASYYRYQPRKIAAYLHPLSGDDLVQETLIMRDPLIGRSQSHKEGQLLRCRVHESVIARICDGTDDYAPITLPPQIEIEPYSADTAPGGNPVVPPLVQRAIEQRSSSWWDWQERLWSSVWRRRLLYFATATISLLLVASPLWADGWAYPVTTDARWVSQRLTGWSDYVVPDLLDAWVAAFKTSPIPFLILLLTLPVLWMLSGREESRLRGKMRMLWKLRVAGLPIPSPPEAPVPLRSRPLYQRSLHKLKWKILPFLFGLGLILLILYLLAIAATQLILSVREPSLCPYDGVSAGESIGRGRTFSFSPGQVCTATGLQVVKDHRYAVTFRVGRNERWQDGTVRATPTGLSAGKLGLIGYLGVPFRRTVDGRYLQPIYQIRPVAKSNERVPQVALKNLPLMGEDGADPNGCRLFHGSFVAEETGQLFTFANDSAPFGHTGYFYRGTNGNKGSATVLIRDLDAPVSTLPEEVISCP